MSQQNPLRQPKGGGVGAAGSNQLKPVLAAEKVPDAAGPQRACATLVSRPLPFPPPRLRFRPFLRGFFCLHFYFIRNM